MYDECNIGVAAVPGNATRMYAGGACGGAVNAGNGVGALLNTSGIPDGMLTLSSDGFYYDSSGGEWYYYNATGRWLKTIVSVVSSPSSSVYQPYFVAYNYINHLEPLWWAFALPLPEEGMVPWGTLVKRFGLRGAVEIADRLLARALIKISASVGAENVLRMTANEANAIMASHGYTKPPFLPGVDVGQFTADSAMQAGQVAGSQLVRVGTNTSVESGQWMTTMDQITNADGTLMSGQEIADRLGLPSVPTYYGVVESVTTGSQFMVGIANDMAKYGWGTGGAIQYYLVSGAYDVAKPIALR